MPSFIKSNVLNRISLFALSLLSGILLILAWPVSQLTLLIFIAWIPLLYISDQNIKRNRFFLLSYIAMLIWNAGTTWWIWNSTAPGAIAAIVVNSFFMCLPLYGYFIFKTNYGQKTGVIALITFWLSFEYIHLNWQLSWPWLTLGNVFATHTGWVQWYEYTGVSGGTLWVLMVNLLLYSIIKTNLNKEKLYYSIAGVVILVMPVVLSSVIAPKSNASFAKNNVIIVQPNIDPYNEKFAPNSTDRQIEALIKLSEQSLDSNTRLVLWPETALPVAVWQDQISESPYYKSVFEFVNRHPAITLQTGIETIKNYGAEKVTNTARKNPASGSYYDVFNAGITLKANEPIQLYNKSKLVPGVETLPDFLLWMGAIFEQFGGTAGGYGHDKEAVAFKENGNPYITAPIICYESIYGEYVTNYVQKGANLLTIMTNDGWWGNTAGHKQHLEYARLRAVETRKWVARSANTGISAVIDNTGEIVDSRKWDEASFIKYSIPATGGTTFYVHNGAIIYKLAIFMLVILLAYHLVMLIKKRFVTKSI